MLVTNTLLTTGTGPEETRCDTLVSNRHTSNRLGVIHSVNNRHTSNRLGVIHSFNNRHTLLLLVAGTGPE